MKLVISLLIITSTVIFSQPKDFLSIAVVRDDGILVPVYRYVNDSLINVQHNYKMLWKYEDLVENWYYYSSDRKNFKLVTGDLIFFDFDGEYGGTGFISSLPIRHFTPHVFPKKISGIATNKEIIPLVKESLNSSELKMVTNFTPKKIRIDKELKKQINSYLPKVSIKDSVLLTMKSCYKIQSSSKSYFYYNTYCSFQDTIWNVSIELNGWITKMEDIYNQLPEKPTLKKQYVIPQIEDKSEENKIDIQVFEFDHRIFFVDEVQYWEGADYFVATLDF